MSFGKFLGGELDLLNSSRSCLAASLPGGVTSGFNQLCYNGVAESFTCKVLRSVSQFVGAHWFAKPWKGKSRISGECWELTQFKHLQRAGRRQGSQCTTSRSRKKQVPLLLPSSCISRALKKILAILIFFFPSADGMETQRQLFLLCRYLNNLKLYVIFPFKGYRMHIPKEQKPPVLRCCVGTEKGLGFSGPMTCAAFERAF